MKFLSADDSYVSSLLFRFMSSECKIHGSSETPWKQKAYRQPINHVNSIVDITLICTDWRCLGAHQQQPQYRVCWSCLNITLTVHITSQIMLWEFTNNAWNLKWAHNVNLNLMLSVEPGDRCSANATGGKNAPESHILWGEPLILPRNTFMILYWEVRDKPDTMHN